MRKMKLDPKNPDDVDFVCDVWDLIEEEDEDISTERLASMVADYLHIEYSDVFDFLQAKHQEEANVSHK